MPALANVNINDTFDVWRTRTNQIIIKLDQLETSDNASFIAANSANVVAAAAFDKANSANVLAYNTGIGANAFASATIAGANTAVGAGANAFASATIAGANTAVGAGANAYAATVGTSANSYLLTVIAGANTAVGAGANAFASATIAGANAAVGAGANAYTNSVRANVVLDTESSTRYVVFANTISGSFTRANVSYGLTFNPSSNTLTSNNINVVTSLSVGGIAPSPTIGEIRATNDITAYYSSDQALKMNVQPISNALDKVMNIRGVEFDWISNYISERGGEDGYFVRKHDVGVIAQEIEKILPEVVATRDNGIKAVRYEKIIALLIEAIKDLNNKIEKK